MRSNIKRDGEQAQAEMGVVRKLEGGPSRVAVVRAEKAWGYGILGTVAHR